MTYRNFTDDERKAIGIIGTGSMSPEMLTGAASRQGDPLDGRQVIKSLRDKGIVKWTYDRVRVKEPWRIFNPDGTRKD